MKSEYTYDAFISYRHTELDKFVAENLHRMLETYRLPKNIVKKYQLPHSGIRRVFRDRDELPLASNLQDPIIEALKSSEFLIIICSPRLKESAWCKREIQQFIEFHGHKNILAVLVEGEPEDSFPEELLHAEESVRDSDGTERKILTDMEPLAADVRGENKRQVRKAMKSELLRLLAPIFSLNYDDLRQRHRERRLKKIIYTSVAVSALCLLFGVGSALTAIRIHRQSEQLKLDQAQRLAEESLKSLEDDDREEAVLSARQALSEYRGTEMPYTAKAQYALTESLHIYDMGRVTRADARLETTDIVEDMKVSPDRDYLLSCDRAGQLILWDLEKKKEVSRRNRTGQTGDSGAGYCFVGNDKFACVDDSSAVISGTGDGKTLKEIPFDLILGIDSDKNGNYLAVNTGNTVRVFDGNSFEKVTEYHAQDQCNFTGNMFFNDDGSILAFGEYSSKEGGKDPVLAVHFLDLKKKRLLSTVELAANFLQHVRFGDGDAYILANLGRDNSDLSMTAAACRVNSGKKLWQRSYDDEYGSTLQYAPDSKSLIACSAYTAYVIDAVTGTEKNAIPVGGQTAGCFYLRGANYFLLFTDAGEVMMIDTVKGDSYMMPELYQMNCRDYRQVTVSEYGYPAIPEQDNCIVLYRTFSNDEAEEYTGNLPERKPMGEKQMQKLAKDCRISKDSPVSAMVYSKDKSHIFVSHANGVLEVYDVSKKSCTTPLQDLQDELKYYLGQDREGNSYFAGDNCGYCFDGDYECTAKIPGLLAVQNKENKLVVGSRDKMYTVPIYTWRNLLGR